MAAYFFIFCFALFILAAFYFQKKSAFWRSFDF